MSVSTVHSSRCNNVLTLNETCDSIDRLSSLVVEEALGMLEYGSVKVTTPLGVTASGMTMLQKVSRLETKRYVYLLIQTL